MIRAFFASLLLVSSLLTQPVFAQTPESFGTYVNGLSGASFPLGSTDKLYIYQGGNSRSIAPDTLGAAFITGNLDVYANPSTGSDTNTCLSSGSPCQTFQHAVYIATQNYRYGILTGTVIIHLADGTYPETVSFPSTAGVPANNSETTDITIDIAGDDANPGNVVISPPNGTCNKGFSQFGHLGYAVLAFGAGHWSMHGVTVTAVNENTYQCSLIATTQGAYVGLMGTNNLGTTKNASAGALDVFAGGQLFFARQTLNVAGGSTMSFFAVVANGGQLIMDGSTLNFTGGTNTFSQFVAAVDGQGEIYGPQGSITITGTTSGLCYSNDGTGIVQGGPASGALPFQTFPGCTQPYGNMQQGANFFGTVYGSALGTDNEGVQPTLSGCGSGASLDAYAGDSDGTITEGTGASGCTLTFQTAWFYQPNCVISSPSNLTFTYTVSTSGIVITNVGGLSSHSLNYVCIQHF